jgi:hypothetical protein
VVHARNLSDSVVETNIKNELSKFGLIRFNYYFTINNFKICLKLIYKKK